ncbi:hypothetical protein FB451DRAFT_1191371 [Mycena latifolia]|nr:hypothetical protein FB451DRAFT_1191371 [Mycena latifolia]
MKLPVRALSLVGLPLCGKLTTRRNFLCKLMEEAVYDPLESVRALSLVGLDASTRALNSGVRGGWQFYWKFKNLRACNTSSSTASVASAPEQVSNRPRVTFLWLDYMSLHPFNPRLSQFTSLHRAHASRKINALPVSASFQLATHELRPRAGKVNETMNLALAAGLISIRGTPHRTALKGNGAGS